MDPGGPRWTFFHLRDGGDPKDRALHQGENADDDDHQGKNKDYSHLIPHDNLPVKTTACKLTCEVVIGRFRPF